MGELVVYGARCRWWDSIDKIGHTSPSEGEVSLPLLPALRWDAVPDGISQVVVRR